MKKCPRCNRNTLSEDKALNALSHIDNKTYICSDCGQAESYIGLAEKGIPTPEILQSELVLHEEFIVKLKKKK